MCDCVNWMVVVGSVMVVLNVDSGNNIRMVSVVGVIVGVMLILVIMVFSRLVLIVVVGMVLVIVFVCVVVLSVLV